MLEHDHHPRAKTAPRTLLFITLILAASLASACSSSTPVAGVTIPASAPPTATPGTPTSTPTPVATATPTAPPTPLPSSAAVTSNLVSGVPIPIPSVSALGGTITFSAAGGTTIPAGATVTLQSFAGEPAGGPAPQSLRRSPQRVHPADLTPEAVASLQAIFNTSQTLTASLAAQLLGIAGNTAVTAEAFNSSGQIIASFTGTTPSGGGGTTTFTSTGQNFAVIGGQSYLFIFVVNSKLPTPSPTPAASASPTPLASPSASSSPTASPAPTPTPTPTAPASVTITETTTQGQLSGLTVSPAGVPYFLDVTNSAIGYVNASGASPEIVIGAPSPAPVQGVFNTESGFAGPAFGSDGNLYFPHSFTNSIGQYVPGAASTTDFPVPSASAQPFSITSGPDGALWFTEENANKIGRMTTSGAFSEYPLTTANALPQQIITGPDGALWFNESGAGKMGRITTSGTVTEYPLSYPGCVGIGIASGPLNSLWYVGCSGNVNAFSIDQVTTSGVQTIYLQPSGFGAADPRFLTVAKDGAIWFTDQNANYIGRFAPLGNGNAVWSKYPYPLVHMGCCGNAGANWIFPAPDGSLWWSEFNTGNVGHLTH